MMRTILLAPLLLLAAAAPAQERRFMVTSFDRLRIDGPFDVEVVTGGPGAVALGDRAAGDRVSVRNNDDLLVVSSGALSLSDRRATLPTLRISTPTLRSIVVNGGSRVRVAEMRGTRVDLTQTGAGSLEVRQVRSEDLNASLVGTGVMTLAGTTTRARIRNTGAGSVDASALSAGDTTLFSESSGDIAIQARFTAQVSALGSGAVRVAGSPKCTVRGPGPVECAQKAIR